MRPVSVLANRPGSEIEQLEAELRGEWRQAARPVMVLLSAHDRSSALVAAAPSGPDLFGGLLFGGQAPSYHIRWLVVSESMRGQGVGHALVADAVRRFVRGAGTLEVGTFGADHPGAVISGARAFYERLGFSPGEAVPPGPEGGSRQIYRRAVARSGDVRPGDDLP